MATYRTLQPGLLNIQRDDGQSVVVPMSEQDAQAQGFQPESAPGGIPMPGPNPYAAMSPDAVAGPGGGPQDMGGGAGVFGGGPPPAANAPGVYQPGAAPLGNANPDQFRQDLAAAQGAGGSHAQQSSLPAKFETGALPAAADKPPLIPVGKAPEPQRVPGRRGGGDVDPIVRAAMDAAGNGGGGGPARMVAGSRTEKFHTSGQVDPALAAATAAGRAESDAAQYGQFEDEQDHKRLGLQDEQKLLEQRALDAQAAQKRRAAMDADLGALQSKSQAAVRELELAKPKDVDQFWKEKGVGAQIAAALAIGFGQYAATLTGGQNAALAIVNNAVDRWTNDQVMKFNAAKDKVSIANNQYKDLLDQYGSPELAKTQLQMQALAAKDALAKNMAEQIGTEDAKGAYLVMQQADAQKRREYELQFQQQAGADVEVKYTQQGGGGGGGNAVLKKLKAGAEAQGYINTINGGGSAEEKKDAMQRQIRLGDGSIVWTNAAPKAHEVQKQLTAGTTAVSLLSQIDSIAGDGPVTDLNKRRQIEALQDRALTAISAAEAQGVVTKADAERAKVALTDQNALLSQGTAGLKATIKAMQQSTDQVVRDNTYTDPQATQPYGSGNASSFKPGL